MAKGVVWARVIWARRVGGVVATALGISLFLLMPVHASVEVKQVMVDSQYMKFPKIPLKGVQYSALAFEYATAGKVEITSIEDRTELSKCGVSSYLHIEHTGPEVVFRVFDGVRRKSLVERVIDTSELSDFGKGQCLSPSELRVEFERNKSRWLEEKQVGLLKGARKTMNAFISKDAAMSYEDIRFPLFFFAADGSKFNRLNQAFDRSRKAFDLYMQFGVTIDAQATLREVASEWESLLSDLHYRKNDNVDDQKVLLALHRNLSITYFFLTQYDQSRRHDALALSRGMPINSSLQPLILENEQRLIYSPEVAKDLVLMSNLYRFGSNVVRDAVLHQADMDTFKLKD